MLFSQFQSNKDRLMSDLTELRSVIEKGWVQHNMKTQHGVCMMGGIREVTHDEVRVGALLWSLGQALIGEKSESMTTSAMRSVIIQFNDQHATKEAVMLVLDRAIEKVSALTPLAAHGRG